MCAQSMFAASISALCAVSAMICASAAASVCTFASPMFASSMSAPSIIACAISATCAARSPMSALAMLASVTIALAICAMLAYSSSVLMRPAVRFWMFALTASSAWAYTAPAASFSAVMDWAAIDRALTLPVLSRPPSTTPTRAPPFTPPSGVMARSTPESLRSGVSQAHSAEKPPSQRIVCRVTVTRWVSPRVSVSASRVPTPTPGSPRHRNSAFASDSPASCASMPRASAVRCAAPCMNSGLFSTSSVSAPSMSPSNTSSASCTPLASGTGITRSPATGPKLSKPRVSVI